MLKRPSLLPFARRFVGIFTERDVLYKVAAQEVDLDQLLVGTLMPPQPESLHVDDDLVYALNQMSLGGYRYIPLLDDQGRPTRVVSERGIVDALAALFAQDVFNLPPAPPLGVPRDWEGA